MATAPKPADAFKFIVARGQFITGPRGNRTVKSVGDGYDPADDKERDRLIAAGSLVSAAEFAKSAAGPAVAAALAAANARADAAEAALAKAKGAAPAAPGAPAAPAQ